LILHHSSLKVKLNFSSSVGIPVDSVSLIIQLIKKPGLSQVQNNGYSIAMFYRRKEHQ